MLDHHDSSPNDRGRTLSTRNQPPPRPNGCRNAGGATNSGAITNSHERCHRATNRPQLRMRGTGGR